MLAKAIRAQLVRDGLVRKVILADGHRLVVKAALEDVCETAATAALAVLSASVDSAERKGTDEEGR